MDWTEMECGVNFVYKRCFFYIILYPFVVYGSHVCALPIQKYRIPCNKRHTCVVSAHGHPRGKEIPPPPSWLSAQTSPSHHFK